MKTYKYTYRIHIERQLSHILTDLSELQKQHIYYWLNFYAKSFISIKLNTPRYTIDTKTIYFINGFYINSYYIPPIVYHNIIVITYKNRQLDIKYYKTSFTANKQVEQIDTISFTEANDIICIGKTNMDVSLLRNFMQGNKARFYQDKNPNPEAYAKLCLNKLQNLI